MKLLHRLALRTRIDRQLTVIALMLLAAMLLAVVSHMSGATTNFI
ncbi:MAG: hypothetical protein QM808_07350 [Steroidobacteraceae bacterium]